jgi:glycosyltransferase involved in cell wall biosynthesis
LLQNKKTIVVIPTYNNPKTIKAVVEDVLKHNYKVIVVDDGSDIPVSSLISKHEDVLVQRHQENQGKGSAIITGAKKAKELGYDYFVSMDGDGQHLASQIHKLIDTITAKDQIIIGARNFDIDNVPKKSIIGRDYHNFWIRLNDSLTGFRLYPVSILDLGLKCDRFDFEVEVLVKHYWKHKDITDIVVECYYPTPEERVSHFDNYWDTIRNTLLHFRFFLWMLFGLKRVF